MRKIDKDPSDVPAILRSNNCKEHVDKIIQNKQFIKKSTYYGHNDVKEKLEILYNNKCAFCETDPTAGAYLEVEHYRPKSEVKNEVHLGYYWLAHEWTNLLYACRRCNGGKSSHFPLATNGIRVQSHSTLSDGSLDAIKCQITDTNLKNEYPLLLNPEIDNPSKHLQFQPNGKIEGITDNGKKTIEICKLNRKSLIIERKKLIDTTMRSLMKDVKALKINEITSSTLQYNFKKEILRIIDIYSQNEPYSILALTLFQYFDVFIINHFQPEDQVHFQQIYTQLKNQFNSL